ncbi:extracellular solute-binding protein [Hydrogenophaga sp. PAMC20947]|uniref:extracellular solute-binding protein n=1 Tax=Hydrogenophaga sp. PAMC20947 TaxID=2565558 RepID=UPI001444C33F|nr:extracellular solute-binding protein [Hydrogenophaga sp. PAMC20947]
MLMPLLLAAACSPAPDSAAPQTTQASAPSPAATEVAQATDEEPVLNFRNWTDYMPEGMLADFERETGIKVIYHTYGTNEELEKLMAFKADSEDLVVPSLNYGGAQATLGFYQPLNKALLSNYKNLDPVFLQSMETADPDNRFFVPWAWGHTTLFVNKTRVSKALGDLAYPSNEWDLVFKPAYTQRLKSCGIAYVDAPSEIFPLALHYLGLNPHLPDEPSMVRALEMLKAVRPDIGAFSSAMLDVLSADKACVGIAWSGDIDSAITALKDAGHRDELLGALPSAGTLMFVDALVIPVNAKHPRNAHAFINFYLRAKNAARMPNEIGYPNGNTAALEFVTPEVKDNPLIFPPPEFFNRLVPTNTFSNKARWDMMQAYVDFAFKIDTQK